MKRLHNRGRCRPRFPNERHSMTRHFDEQLQEVFKKIALMGSLADAMVALALRVLIERDESLSEEIYRKEDEVNHLQVEIDEEALQLIAMNQPVARDVRFLFTATKIVTDLERIADQAKNICQSARWVLAQPAL